jgi:hypothetical protein
MSGRYATEHGFFDDRQRLACGCIRKCSGHNDAAQPFAGKVKIVNAGGYQPVPANPKGLHARIVSMLVSADLCATCLSHLDAELRCTSCGYDWKPWMDASKKIHDAAFDKREG